MNDIHPDKRVRRTKEDIEKALFQAAISVIEKVGFQGLTVTSILKEAKADPPVFYNRYKDMNDFIEKFVRNYDYWLNDSIAINIENDAAVDNIRDIMIHLIDELRDNSCMQKLLAWELSDNNFITRRTAQNRDNNSESLIGFFESRFKKADVNFNVATAILIGGIYYLIIHREVGTFNKIDFSTKEGIGLLKSTIAAILSKLFDDSVANPSKEVERIAVELMKNGVSIDIIQRSTGLSKSAIMALQ